MFVFVSLDGLFEKFIGLNLIQMRKTFTLFLLLVLGTATIKAQDIHFSQFWASPLTLTPANAGNFDGSYRGGIIYRSQWASFSPYKTFSAFYDMNLGKGLAIGDALSGGIVFYYDKAGDLPFTTTTINLNGAYHKAFGLENRLSIGLQVGYNQKKLDMTSIQFADMFQTADGDFTGITSELLAADPSVSGVDFSAGVAFTRLINSNLSANIGIGALHLTKPEEDFIPNGTVGELGRRYTANAGVNYKLNEKISINPKVLYMNQTKAQEISLGSDVGYKLENEKFPATVYGGLWYRHNDAVIPYVGMDYKGFRFGFSYDVNVSSLTVASNGNGGFEISLIYIGKIVSAPPTIIVPCIRF